MGMFDKDRLYGGERLDKWCEPGDRFILWGVEIVDEPVPTSVGNAIKTLLKVSTLDAPENQTIVGTLASAIAEKAKDAEESDFPAVVEFQKVHSQEYNTEAAVIQFVEPYDLENPPTAA